MSRLFGTDGARGLANATLTPELAFGIGQAAGRRMVGLGLPPRVAIGRDTRRSGPMLGAALAAGFCSAGVEAVPMGVVPTGGVSWIVRSRGFGLGAVVSASHNPAPDNGIKLIQADGRKVEAEFERWIEDNLGSPFGDRPTGDGVGRLVQSRDGVADYEDWLVSLVPERLDGMSVVVDGSNGAAFESGPEVFRRLGAKVQTVGTDPDGDNINTGCGATRPHVLQEATRNAGADLGVAFDGDADRAVFADSTGKLVNGDWMMGLWCAHWHPTEVVGTVMSNGGFEHWLAGRGVQLVRVDVGDKYVSAKLREIGGKIGGEQSGHIVFPDHGPTGDGLVTALELARVLKREGKTLAEAATDCLNWPQVLVNVQVDRKDGWEDASAGPTREAEAILSGRGRINVRASGTQPILRVMVEADDQALRDRAAELVVQALLTAQGGKVYSRVDLTHALGD
ncbi:MAG: phosphoglucosamine mutase [Fimbriimonadaceae bacterium]|nr:phosphoglucosamine mutase [Fimbriimonadaceae bacterium]